MKYKLMKFIDTLSGLEYERCRTCGRILNQDEIYYYGTRCNKCEKKAWRELNRT